MTKTLGPGTKTGLFNIILIWLLLVLTSAFIYRAAAADSPPELKCMGALTEDINPRLMSRTTATRKARSICRAIETSDRAFYKALTQ